jgi:anti-anti-sigma regulatory factor
LRQPFTIQARGEELVLSGAIDENARLDEIVSRARGGRLTLDLGGVTFINSIGVREWARMQQAAVRANVRIELRRVVEQLIHQMNIVPAARGNSLVSSFFAPYLCEDCDREDTFLLDVSVYGKDLARLRPPAQECPSCGGRMGLSDPPELYLSFFQG